MGVGGRMRQAGEGHRTIAITQAASGMRVHQALAASGLSQVISSLAVSPRLIWVTPSSQPRMTWPTPICECSGTAPSASVAREPPLARPHDAGCWLRPSAYRELERGAAVLAGVELGAGREGAGVVHGQLVAGLGEGGAICEGQGGGADPGQL